MIEAEVGQHSFDGRQWPIVRRMIHASGDLELVQAIAFTHDAAEAGYPRLASAACRS